MKRVYIVTVLTCLAILGAFYMSFRLMNITGGKDHLTVGFIYDNDESTPYTYNFSLAKDAVEKIKAAEDEAQKLVTDAQNEARRIITDAKAEAKSFEESEIKTEKEAAAKELSEASKKAESEILAYLDSNLSKNAEKLNSAEKNKEKAIAGVIKLLF